MSAYVKASAVWANYRSGAWELGTLRGSSMIVDGQQVIGARTSAITAATGGTIVDNEGRAVIDQILVALRTHGLIES
jgi:hypothetical protein